MPPLLLLATLATAGDAHLDEQPAATRVWSVGDLAVESALQRLGLSRDQAVNTTATWTLPISAPDRSRAQGRTANWGFDLMTTQVVQRRLDDGEITLSGTAAGVKAADPACLSVHASQQTPVILQALGPRIGVGPDSSRNNDGQRLSLTVVARADEQTLLVRLQPGESALVVELSAAQGSKVRERARQSRRIAVQTHTANVVVSHSADRDQLCVRPLKSPP